MTKAQPYHTADLSAAASLPANVLWTALSSLPDIGACVIDAVGRTVRANELGQRISALAEALDLAKQALLAGASRESAAVLDGAAIRLTAHPVPNATVALVVASPSRSQGAVDPTTKEQLTHLTTREREVLRLIGMGLSTSQIATRLSRSMKTVEWHRVSLGSKLKVKNRVELARIAIAAGLVQAFDPLTPRPLATTNGHPAKN
ncbi:MAG TPA: LuxR C-terminal-related transcriptional regulator [Phycisphaerales bacterium]|nr:LuxR C-terminal-related transcriptional regulator [Phycisphaerales bacterium]